MPLEIVRAESCHAELIADIEQKCFRTPWTIANVLGELSLDIAELWVAYQEGKAAGYIGYKVIGDEIHMGNVAVLSEFRRQGVATALLNQLFTRAKNLQISKATLEVRFSNTAAINLYKSYGFVAEGVRKKYYDDGEDALIMWRYNCEQTVQRRSNLL